METNPNDYYKNIENQLAQQLEPSVIKFLDYVVEHAYSLRASDIHLDPVEEGLKIRFRVDGVLQDIYTFHQNIHSEVVSRIKILCGLRTDEHQATQDGRFTDYIGTTKPIDIRVSIVPTYHGENAVLRLLADKVEQFTLETLGFGEDNVLKIDKAIRKPWGMILATGPTGSGKTTTLYTLIKLLNNKDVSIITIEDPIEYDIKDVSQIQVNPRTNLTFAKGLRSIIRQDPNIIMVGEIRDFETASLAVNTALTGHLLLSTIHTTDAVTTIVRLLDMKIESFLIASTVNLAIAQRLVRKICNHCKVSHKITKAEYQSLSGIIPAKLLEKAENFYRGKGCPECNQTGYQGRISINEVLVTNDAIREAILRRESSNKLKQVAIDNGMTTMLEDGFQKALKGITTIEEVLRVINE
ncbi:MAG: ATPase, T2SS/T4P/T4SS family [Candidatus Nealsonbacteria bacterium]|nr:ATPase, T2SS/T4P/T4SS family [Candidatus Nealsonbacteria bacterium]